MKITSAKDAQQPPQTPDYSQSYSAVGEKVNEKLSGPGKYVVTKDNTFKIRFGLMQHDGRWVVVKPETTGADDHWVEFRVWSFNEEVELRKMSTQFDPLKKIHIIDNDYLNRLKVQRLLLNWSFDEQNPKLKLLHVGGVLSDEGWKAFTSLFPTIVRFILEAMNAVLEHGE
jgi:hypothetical protein